MLLTAVGEGRIRGELVDADSVRRLRLYPGEDLQRQVGKLFPDQVETLPKREARMESLSELIREGQGSPMSGRELYFGKASCGKCHRLFNEGGEIGPDLTPYNRTELSRMLLAVVHPSAEVREGYEVFTVLTDDGRALSGFKVDQTDQLLVLRGADGQNQTIPTSQIEEVSPNDGSLMPDGLLEGLTDVEIRDLFAFLSSTTPPM
jgi:putative heme-binding domain-containing protein